MPSILITQCLQRDFIDPILPHEPLPNLLHVGHAESLRLLGHDPFSGPIAQLMSWARAQSADALDIIHIRDWHDKDDPRQRDHLKQFGEHCIGGTPGAQLILDLDAELGKRPNECAVDSIALNDFQDTKLAEKLDSIRARTVVGASRPHPPLAESAQTSGAMGPGRPHDVPLRIGVVGVWTEAKVSFLLYDLKTRYGVHEIATCSALTASASRAQHFNALEQLSRILGVRVFDTVGEFATWLKPGSTSLLPVATKKFGHHVAVKGASAAAPPLSAEDHDIVGYLFRDSSSVTLEPLSGGFSGALVFRATSQDALQHQQAPSVVKLGPSKLIGAERVAFERVEQILGNNAPSVRGFAELGPRAGIKYSFAAMGQGKVRSLKSLFEHNRPVEQLETVIRSVFGDVLRPFYSAARYDRLPLLEHYRFSPEFAPGVRKNVHAIVADRAGDDRLE
ncbi:MAG TPA: isochorismatase, partial [Planctomycetota bacterium]|nr:isochorismatase [Planctomycetota bacterium]